jgi:hypothetical protein
MDTNLSVAQILSDMEAQIAHHESQEAFHAQQEVFHREHRTLHAEGLSKLRERYEAFKAGVSAIGESFQDRPQPAPPPPPQAEPDPDKGRRPSISKLVLRLVSSKSGEEVLTPKSVAKELNERFATKLQRRVTGRDISVYLRRLHAEGRLHLVRKGSAAHEAVYTRASQSR